MVHDLLSTKLFIPLAPAQPVVRPRLLELLDEGLNRKLILLSAPAGFGKTTLLSMWCRECPVAVAWLSLDEGDNDIARFIAYLVAALQKIDPIIGVASLTAFQFPQRVPIDSVMIPLLNDISTLPQSFVIVLDDYHLIQAQAIHDALEFLLERLPPQAHVVIATRADPPIHLSRLRGRGQLTELRAADLRFTAQEATAFLNQVMNLALSVEEIETLETRTEGWITGLQLAALSMRQSKDLSGFITAFSGSHEYIVDYLSDEVLNQQPEQAKRFLLETSILDRFCGPLCEAVTGQVDGQRILHQLATANLFLISLDGERKWYRYHQLLAEVLRARLHIDTPERVPELHRRASVWYESQSLIAEATHHALEAQDFERAAVLCESIAEATIMRSEVITVKNWVEALPDDLLRAHSRLSTLYAVALLMAGHSLEMIEARLRETAAGSDVAAFEAVISTFRGDVREAEELTQRALERLPEDSLFLRGVLAWNLAIASMMSCNFRTSLAALQEAILVGQKSGNLMITVVALCHQAEVTMILGRLREAELLYQQAIEIATDEQGLSLPVVGFALIGLGELQRERNNIDRAEQLLQEGIRRAGYSGILGLMDGYITLARVRQAQCDPEGANRAIQQAGEIAAKFDATELDDFFVNLYRTRLLLAQGDIPAARAEYSSLTLTTSDSDATPTIYVGILDQIMLARLLIAEGRFAEALALLDPLVISLERQGCVGAEIEVLALCSLAFDTLGDIDQAHVALERALRLAEEEGYARIFLDEGPHMARLLHDAAKRGISPQYSRWLLTQVPATVGENVAISSASGLIEPLSEREIEVLQLIAKGCTNAEIARCLFISLSTVKWHTSNIFSKLDCGNRTQAVAKARGLGILPDIA